MINVSSTAVFGNYVYGYVHSVISNIYLNLYILCKGVCFQQVLP